MRVWEDGAWCGGVGALAGAHAMGPRVCEFAGCLLLAHQPSRPMYIWVLVYPYRTRKRASSDSWRFDWAISFSMRLLNSDISWRRRRLKASSCA